MHSYTNKKGVEFKDINTIHSESLFDFFHDRIGRKVMMLSSSFPYLFIGIILDVIDDVVRLQVETTSIPTFEGKEWCVHIDFIEVFYIEEPGGPKIPKLVD